MHLPFCNRIVVKVGTSTLTDPDGRIDRSFITDLTAQLASQRAHGRDVLLVSSGAIRAGREALSAGSLTPRASPLTPLPSTLPYKQAAAAVGQGLLMHTYAEAFAWRGVKVGQVLLTRDDLAERRRFLNARNTLRALLALGVVPVINENDTVAVDEIRFGDNDTLAARVAVLAEADLLLILSDVEGLYPNAGCIDSGDEPIRLVDRIDERLEAAAGDSTSGAGTGGMKTKVAAARIATASGIRTVIARGRREGVIADVVEQRDIGTTFAASCQRLRGRKRWIAAGSRPVGSLTVNAGAAMRLREGGASLLAVGIVDVSGDFGIGDLIELRDGSGRRFARGISNYSAADIRIIKGLRSDQLAEALGSKTHDEVVHRDNLVVERSGDEG